MKLLWVIFLSFSISGCFIQLPSSGPKGYEDVTGQVYELNEPVILYSGHELTSPFAVRFSEEEHYINSEKVGMLRQGEKIKVRAVRSVLAPIGKLYIYKCESLNDGVKFDLSTHRADVLGLRKYHP